MNSQIGMAKGTCGKDNVRIYCVDVLCAFCLCCTDAFKPSENWQRFWWLWTLNREQGLWFNFLHSYIRTYLWTCVTCKWYLTASSSLYAAMQFISLRWPSGIQCKMPLNTCSHGEQLTGLIRWMIFYVSSKSLIFIVLRFSRFGGSARKQWLHCHVMRFTFSVYHALVV